MGFVCLQPHPISVAPWRCPPLTNCTGAQCGCLSVYQATQNSQGEEQVARVQSCTAAGLNTKSHPNPASHLSSDLSTLTMCMWWLAQALAP